MILVTHATIDAMPTSPAIGFLTLNHDYRHQLIEARNLNATLMKKVEKKRTEVSSLSK
jgi:hypothetical protein